MGIAELINKEKKTAFYYNQKINCMPAKGKMEYNGKIYLENDYLLDDTLVRFEVMV